MKLQTKKNWRLVCNMLTIPVLCYLLCACGGKTETDPVPPSLTVNPSNLEFLSSKGDSKTLEIRTDENASWEIYDNDVKSHVSVSSTSGVGTTSVTLTTKNDNEQLFSGQLQIVAKDNASGLTTKKNVSITQLGSIQEDCYARIANIGNSDSKNMLVMSHGMVSVMIWGNNTKYFLYHLYKDTEFSNISGNNDKIVEEATKYGSSWKQINVPSSGGVEIECDDCVPNTRYVFVAIAFSASGKRGEIYQEPIMTKGDTDDQPLASVTPERSISENDIQGGNSGSFYKWTVKQNRSSNSYYTYVCASSSETETMKQRNEGEYGKNKSKDGVGIAWEIYNKAREGWNESKEVEFNKGNKSCREKLFTEAIKDGEFSFAYDSNDKYLQIVTWALDKNGEFSGLVYDVVYKVQNGVLYPDPNPNELYVNPAPTSLEFSAKGGTEESKKVEVRSNTSWEASSSSDWCKIDGGSKVSGTNSGSFSVTVDENKTYIQRSATITVTGGKESRIINVTQLGLVKGSVIGRDDYEDDKNLDE